MNDLVEVFWWVFAGDADRRDRLCSSSCPGEYCTDVWSRRLGFLQGMASGVQHFSHSPQREAYGGSTMGGFACSWPAGCQGFSWESWDPHWPLVDCCKRPLWPGMLLCNVNKLCSSLSPLLQDVQHHCCLSKPVVVPLQACSSCQRYWTAQFLQMLMTTCSCWPD